MMSIRLASATALCALLGACIIVPIPIPAEMAKDVPFAVTLPAGGTAAAAKATPIPAATCPRPARTAALQQAVIAEVNALRASRGLGALRASDRLAAIAQNQACDNASRQIVSHTSSDGRGLTGRATAGGYRWLAVAENVGLGPYGDAKGMVGLWKASPGHLRNMLNPRVTEAGLGLADHGGEPAWVLDLGRPR